MPRNYTPRTSGSLYVVVVAAVVWSGLAPGVTQAAPDLQEGQATPTPTPTPPAESSETPTVTATDESTATATPTPSSTGTPAPPGQPLRQAHVPDELVVRFSPGLSAPAMDNTLRGLGAEVWREIRGLGIQVLRVPEDRLDQVLAALSHNPNIEFVEPNYIATTMDEIPSDPHFAEQWGLAAIGAPAAWGVTTGSADVTIAIVDTGVDLTHPDLDGKIVRGWDFVNDDADPKDDNGHGTHVAGIAAAESNNGIGVAGVSWGAWIMPIKVLNSSGSGSYADVAAGIVYAVDNGAEVINLSLGGSAPSEALRAAIQYAYSANVVVVAAAGNTGAEGLMYPAAYPEVIAVGAVDRSVNWAAFSSYGQELDLVAPGVDIVSTCRGASYCVMAGTSMATSHVTGSVALLLGVDPSLNPAEVRALLQASSRDLGPGGPDSYFGAGLVYISSVLSVPTPTPTPTSGIAEDRSSAMISDTLFLYSSPLLDFDIQSFLNGMPGPLAAYSESIDGATWTAADTIRHVSMLFGINPQVTIVLIEAESGALTHRDAQIPVRLGQDGAASGFHYYVYWILEETLKAYDAHRYGEAVGEIAFPDGGARVVPLDSNPGTYAVRVALALELLPEEWDVWSAGPEPAFTQLFLEWFGDALGEPLSAPPTVASLPGGYRLPFPVGETWYFTGGPHNYGGGTPGCVSGSGCPRPWSAIDIAQPQIITCTPGSTAYAGDRWVVASRGGNVIQSSQGLVVVDHGDGWLTYYVHVSSVDRRGTGGINQGDRIGHPSCEVPPNGSTRGVHVHFAIWHEGQGFVDISGSALSGWSIQETTHYNGTMTREGITRRADTGRKPGINDILHTTATSCPQSGGVILYWNANQDCSNSQGDPGYRQYSSAGVDNNLGSFNDQASSIFTPSGWSARLFEHADGNGGSICISSSQSNFATLGNYPGTSTGINDTVSRVEVFSDSQCGQGGSNPGDTVTLFEHPNQGGTQYGWHDPGAFNLPDYMNDRGSSIWIAPGWAARVFEHANSGGGKRCFDGSDTDLTNDTYDNGVAVNDSISSIEIYNQETCPAAGGGDTVTLYENPNFSGTQYGWHDPGVFNLPDYMDRRGSSIWVASGWSARVYQGVNATGASQCFSATDSDFTNDTLSDGQPVNDNFSSIEIYSQEICPATDMTPPTGSMLAPPDSSQQRGPTILLQATAADSESGVQRVEFYGWSNSAWSGQQWILLGTDTAAPYELNWDVTTIQEGGVWVSIDVVDNAGNHSGIIWDPDWVYFTIDKSPPSSAVEPLPAQQSSAQFVVRWGGSDNYTPTASLVFDVQFQIGCVGEWYLWNSTSSTSATFNGTVGQSYCFRSRARDLAGNVEDWPTTPDATTSIVTPPANDNIASARTIDTIPYVNSQGTGGATLEAGEPSYTCGYNNAASVWYRFAPGATGQLAVDTFGSDYDTVLHVFEDLGGGSLSPLACNDDADGLQSRVMFSAEASASYLISVTHYGNGTGGSLTLNLSELACPSTGLCVLARDGTGGPAWYPKVTVLDTAGNWVAEGSGGSDGYVVIDPIPSGTYRVITSAWGMFVVSDGVTVPGVMTVSAEGLPGVQFIARDSAGAAIDAEVVLAESPSGFGPVGYAYAATPLLVNMTPGTYDVTMIGYADRYVLASENRSISSDGQSVILDASVLPTDTVTLDWDGFDRGFVLGYVPFTSSYWFWIDVPDGQSVTLSSPESYYPLWTEVSMDDTVTGDTWAYRAYDCCFTTGSGGSSTTLTVGGPFTVTASSERANYLPGEMGTLRAGVTDAHGNEMVAIWHWDADATGVAFQAQAPSGQERGVSGLGPAGKGGEDDERLPGIGGTPGSEGSTGQVGPPTSGKGVEPASVEDVTAQGLWLLITPSYQVTDALGASIGGSTVGEGLFAEYEFAIPNPANEGVWQGRATVDFGPYQAPGSGTTNFNVVTVTIPNDDFDNATIIAATPFTASQEMWAASVATDDPTYPCTGLPHYRTVWYRFVAPTDGTLSVNTFGSGYDTVLAVWTGARGNLSNVVCNDDAAGVLQSEVTVQVLGGTTYFVEISGYSSSSVGSLNLSAAFTHAVGTVWYLAEGYTGAGFGTYILIQNPNPVATDVTVTYMLQGGGIETRTITVPGNSRYTIVAQDAGQVGPDRAFSTRLESQRPIIVERAMYWPNGDGTVGGHVATGITEPSTTWYLAEGYTGAGFGTFILVQNPNAVDANVTVTYMLQGGGVEARSISVPANSRYTIVAHDPAQLGVDRAFSTKLESDQPIIVERAMYFANEGHAAGGLTSSATTWYLAEGYTGAGFGTYILIQNPNPADATVTLTYMLQGGGTETRSVVVPGNSRYTVVAQDPAQVGVDRAFSTRLVSDQPIIVERAMYWPNGASSSGGHDSAGVLAPATTWYLAEGYTGAGFGTFILIQNPNASAANVTVTYMLQGGGVETRSVTVPGNSRYTILAHDPAQVGLDRAFSTMLDSDQPIIVERAMYFANGGHDAAGVVMP